ncbi:ATP-grasp domain-containing protein [Salinispora arenicola]|uniref:ATP-grasp domain-containing protein n=1 Tax=Salinispora arenicola TaxID=168697 RepID=UPI00036D8B3A|nr:hypothetical protein [Salinispora arenicola]
MSLLILHRGELSTSPYLRYVDGYPGEVLLLASAEKLRHFGETIEAAESGYRHIEVIEAYDVSGELERRALELARRFPVSQVFAANEFDLERAAALREILGIPGQTTESALAFRDKLVMKDLARRAGLGVPAAAPIDVATDLLLFADRHGFPVMVKPRSGAGAIGTRVITDREDLYDYLNLEFTGAGGYHPNLMVEAFVAGTVHHVDGVVVDDQLWVAWPSRYLDALGDFRRGDILLDVMLDPTDELGQRLVDFTARLLDAMPTPPHYAFHAEIFHTPDDELQLCEIASRTGGAKIKETVRAAFDIDLTEIWIRATSGLPLPQAEASTRRPRQLAGSLLMLSRPGVVRSLPAPPADPWLVDFGITATVGDRISPAYFCGDLLGWGVVSGESRAACEERLSALAATFRTQTVIG